MRKYNIVHSNTTANLKSISAKSKIRCGRIDCESGLLNFVFFKHISMLQRMWGGGVNKPLSSAKKSCSKMEKEWLILFLSF